MHSNCPIARCAVIQTPPISTLRLRAPRLFRIRASHHPRQNLRQPAHIAPFRSKLPHRSLRCNSNSAYFHSAPPRTAPVPDPRLASSTAKFASASPHRTMRSKSISAGVLFPHETLVTCTATYETKRMTLVEIARLAKVSTATVSRAINRVPSVNPVLARQIGRASEEHTSELQS